MFGITCFWIKIEYYLSVIDYFDVVGHDMVSIYVWKWQQNTVLPFEDRAWTLSLTVSL